MELFLLVINIALLSPQFIEIIFLELICTKITVLPLSILSKYFELFILLDKEENTEREFRYIEKYKDKVREKFVNFSGKKELKLKRVGLTPTTAKEEELLNGTSDGGIANGTILASYTVGASDINRANRNGRIEEGKTNPFEPYVEEVPVNNGGEGCTSGESSEKKSNTSTGRLFESSKSK